MLFNTWTFAAFFAIVFALYCLLDHRWQNRMLLAASCIFYGAWNWRFVFLMLGTASFDYFVGREIARDPRSPRARRWLIGSIVVNLGVLGVFKYFNFFVDSAQTLLAILGIHVPSVVLRVVLPVGISFYTFQSMAYTIDIYRGVLQPAMSLGSFLLFVSYFPHLVAGPINRPQGLLRQCEQPRAMTWAGWRSGAFLFLIGLVKKVVIADQVSPIADALFAHPRAYASSPALVGVYAFSLQIYADFSGYTDMARGMARIMGFELNENFHQPYLSQSITEFWRRWHISLSSWLRDYLYIPLGGSRKGLARTYANLIVTMLLGGLWHGASWRLVLWGGLHGSYLALHKALLELRPRRPSDLLPLRLLKVLLTFHLVTLTWIFFRADTLHDAFAVIGAILGRRPEGTGTWDPAWNISVVALGLLVIFLLDLPQYIAQSDSAVLRWPLAARAATLFALVAALVATRSVRAEPFIYFQF
jgi:D-alanyl-lipoteichoic acid acyltransferase DltB (MBOAT superfamily)